MNRATTKTAAVLCALALTATACSSSNNDSGLADGGTYTGVISSDPGNLDPANAILGVTRTALAFAYDTLIMSKSDGTFAPQVASSWEVSPSSVTFQLRDDVICSDGSKLTASMVAQNFSYLADPANKSPLLGVSVQPGLTATADDAAHKVTLKTATPYGFLLNSSATVFLVCGKGLQDRSVLAKGTSGSGPYQLSEAVADDHYTFTLRPGAHDKGVPAKAVIKVVPNESTAVNMLASGQVNAAVVIGPDRARAAAINGVTTRTAKLGPGEYFFHQGADRPGSDPLVRKALVQAINVDELAKIAGSGVRVPQTGLVTLEPKACPGDTVSGTQPAQDATAAKSSLDSAGWIAGADGIREKQGKKLNLRFVYKGSDAGSKAAAEFLSSEWRKLGVTTELRGVPDTQLSATVFSTGDWEVVWLPIGVTLPSEVMPFVSGPAAPNGTNFAHLNNAEYTRLATQAIGTPGKEGCDLWNQAEKALFTSFDVMPVMTFTGVVAMRKMTADFTVSDIEPRSIRLKA